MITSRKCSPRAETRQSPAAAATPPRQNRFKKMSESSDDDLFCSPRTTKKAKPPPKKKAKTTSILDQVMAQDAKTEARVNQLKEMNAASRKDLGEQAPSSGVAIDWDYIRRKPGSIAARAEAAVRAVDERPGGILVWKWCWGVRRCVASVCPMLILLKSCCATHGMA